MHTNSGNATTPSNDRHSATYKGHACHNRLTDTRAGCSHKSFPAMQKRSRHVDSTLRTPCQ
eukprot:364208-Chlamydomonas_euryale.AAC.11